MTHIAYDKYEELHVDDYQARTTPDELIVDPTGKHDFPAALGQGYACAKDWKWAEGFEQFPEILAAHGAAVAADGTGARWTSGRYTNTAAGITITLFTTTSWLERPLTVWEKAPGDEHPDETDPDNNGKRSGNRTD
ncbi:hypothetical protein [Mycobacteroides abscessus]|uniref:hypothetical protein n=1 Tax=Mycobacteroides abscessus TaxID=36809 RepID=UPI000C2585BD|nr:hypothetical protein [Mycobacteroides abscessus]